MVQFTYFEDGLWAASFAIRIVLLALLLSRKNYRRFPSLTFYILIVSVKSVFLYFAYAHWGFDSPTVWPLAWASIAVGICARALAVAELCRLIIARYKGVWALTWRLLLASSIVTLLFSLLAIRGGWFSIITIAQLGVELAITVVIVGLLVLGKYYQVALEQPFQSLALGFCLYSSFSVLNNTVWQRLLSQYDHLWNVLGMLAFLASLLIWVGALRTPYPASAQEEVLLPASVYGNLSPAITSQLKELNRSLGEHPVGTTQQ